MRAVAAQCNKQKYNAKKAGEMSSDLYMLKYIEMNSPIQTEAVVVEVREKYIDVIVVALGLNRRIFFNTVSFVASYIPFLNVTLMSISIRKMLENTQKETVNKKCKRTHKRNLKINTGDPENGVKRKSIRRARGTRLTPARFCAGVLWVT